MQCSWALDSILVASAKVPPGASSTNPTSKSQIAPPTIMKQNFGYDNPCVRKLLNESHGIFVQFLESVKGTDPKSISAVLLQTTSIEFRVSIRACCEGLERYILESTDQTDGNGRSDKLERLLLLYRHLEIIWGLCDALFFRPQGEYLISDLLEWSRWIFTEPDATVKEMMEWQKARTADGASVRLEQHEKYWNTVFNFLLTGRVEEARKLLRAHSRSRVDQAFRSMDEIMRSFPFAPIKHKAVVSQNDFLAWRDETKRRVEGGQFIAVKELEAVGEILLGTDETFRRLAPLCSGWYQLVVGRILFTQPFANMNDLHCIADECMEMIPRDQSQWTSLDKTLYWFLQLNILNALKELCSSFRNWWCATHLGLLLWHGGCTKIFSTEQNENFSLRDYLLLEYGESLMTSGGPFWQIGADYLAACPEYGIHTLRLFLERIPLDSKDVQKTFKLLEICRKHKLLDTVKSICKEKSIGALKSGDLSEALTWCFQANSGVKWAKRAETQGIIPSGMMPCVSMRVVHFTRLKYSSIELFQDTQFTTYIAEQLLQVHGTRGALRELAIFDNLDNLDSPLITFLCKYQEMHKYKTCENWRDCGTLLAALISSEIAPRSFWIVLFQDVLDVLKAADKQLVFDAAQTYRIMDALATMTLEMERANNHTYYNSDRENRRLDKTTMEKTVKALRTRLVKSLSVALLYKPQMITT